VLDRIRFHRIAPTWGLFSVDRRAIDREDFYFYRLVPCQFSCRAYEVWKLTKKRCFHLRIYTPTTSKCECWQFERTGDCHHIEALIRILYLKIKVGQSVEYDSKARG
jgi:hypothetical protein